MDVEREIVELRENQAAIRERCNSMTERMDMGDRNVRQGIEVVKEGMVDLRGRVEDIADQLLGDEGKRAIREDISDIRSSQVNVLQKMTEIENKFTLHETGHAVAEGRQRTWDSFKERWLAPLIVGLLIGAPTLVVAIVALRSG